MNFQVFINLLSILYNKFFFIYVKNILAPSIHIIISAFLSWKKCKNVKNYD